MSAILVASMAPLALGSQSLQNETLSVKDLNTLATSGVIAYPPPGSVLLAVDFSTAIGTNNLGIGTQITYQQTLYFPNSATEKSQLQSISTSLIRVFDSHIGYTNSGQHQPCLSWNDTSESGTFDWTDTDKLIQAIYDVGAEPLMVLGYASSTGMSSLPPGIGINATTLLPEPDNWAAYCSSWVRHFSTTGKPVRFYEIVNEPQTYFGWTPNPAKLGYYMNLFNTTRRQMLSANSNLLIGFDDACQQTILDYMINNNIGIDLMDYHKYDTGVLSQSSPNYDSDTRVFMLAEREYFTDGYPYIRSVKNARDYYQSHTGRHVYLIDSESNLNYNNDGGSDPRMVMMNGTIWEAMMLRKEILAGVDYHIHFTSEASKSYEMGKTYGGYGDGLIDSDTNKPWYPYYLYQMLGDNLFPNDTLYAVSVNSSNMRAFAWIHDGKENLLIIHSSTATDTIQVAGFNSPTATFSKLDNTISFLNPSVQTGTIYDLSNITVNGYTVMLLQH